ncbi:MAG TPA: WD40 repeat domain-containing protein [Chloroflexi bacterium]|nr:MAG: hypothetical protein DRI46_07900 [Chloroflexota bacterium]HDD55007.1 WD40 repeat domain-containing protein [Chloroflexota bacterium]
MRRINLVAAIFLLAVASGCVEQETQAVEPSAIPTAIPTTQIPSPEPLPTETIVLPTETITPAPLPTETPRPFLPPDLALLNYQTLGRVEELASISLPEVIDLEFSPDGRFLRMRVPAGEQIHEDIFYDLGKGEEIFRLEGGQRIYFNPDSTTIAALDGTSLTIHQLPSGEETAQFNGKNQLAALSPDGRLIVEAEAVDPGTTLTLVDLTSGEDIYQIYINGTMEEESLHFDLDGKNMAVTYFVPPGTYVSTIWSVKTGWAIFTEYGYTEIALHPFGSEVAVSSARQSYISLISTVTWDQRDYLGSAGEDPGYYDIAYASRGRLIYALSGVETTTASFWYPPSGEKIDLDLGLDLLAVTISPDRRYLATSDKSGSVIIWGIPE